MIVPSKYRNVKPVIDTGFNTRCAKEELLALSKEFRIKPSEAFKRIGLHALALLVLEVAELEELEREDRIQARMISSAPDGSVFSLKLDEIPSVASLMRGMDGPSTGRETRPVIDDTWKRPYLLLDVRDCESFCKESIATAKNYPASKLSRVNWEAPFLRHYKNKRERLIVIFDDDELLGAKAATILVERGYENVYLLSGGLNLARKRFRGGGLVVKTKVLDGDAARSDNLGSEDGSAVEDDLTREFGSLHRPGALERLRRDTAGLNFENVIGKGTSSSDGKLAVATQTERD